MFAALENSEQPDAADRKTDPGGTRGAGARWPELGPTDDGGYYLSGMRHPHPRLFADSAWRTGGVAAATLARATALDLDVVTLPTRYDAVDAATSGRPGAGADHGCAAPATDAWIERDRLRGRVSLAAI